jgi:Domain of unknown function (DUF5916)/Carbohydrate family 9 binding domain-like
MRLRGLFTLLLLLCALTMSGQQPAPQAPPPPGPQGIKKTTVPVNLDGDISDEAWQQATVIDRFYETSPGDNNEPKVKTVAYVTYDDRYFYIGIRADDPDPRRIRAPFVDRDGVIGTDDNIAVFLDTRNDKRSAIEIRVNPRGIQADGIFNDANFNEDFSPDYFYDTAAKITNTGWTAEFRIPFSSLRYDAADPQTWNILVWRNYPREYRYAFHSAPIPRGSNCLICHMHPLTGFTGLPDASNLVVAPYVTAQQAAVPETTAGSPLRNDDLSSDAGVDVKWNPTANSALDITVNPDFSTIETDVPQITVNRRFAVFYPEKRPFFLEGFDLFDTPLNVAYTRNIADPAAGARSTGQFGSTAYTVLVTQDEGGGDIILPGPQGNDAGPTDFKSIATIGRVRHDLGKGFVGAVLTSREISGGGHNRVVGPDFQWRPSGSDSLTGQFLISDTENPNRTDLHPSFQGQNATSHAFSLNWSHQKRGYDWFIAGRDIGEDFRADLGFVTQAGFRDVEAGAGLRFYPEGKLRYVRPSVVVARQTDRDNESLYETVSLGVNGIGIKNMNFFVGYRPTEKILVGNKMLDQAYADFFLQFDPYRRIPRVTLSATFGDSIDFAHGRVGDGMTLSIGTTVRPHDRLDVRFDASRQTLDVDGGRLFTAQFERLRVQYSFSAKSLVRVIGQYVSTDRDPALYSFPVSRQSGNFLGNVLYSYKLNWQTVLFVGYGDTRLLTSADDLVETGRSLFFKVSYAYQR